MIFINAADRLLVRLGINKQMTRIVARMSTAMLLRLMRIVVSFSFNVLLARMLGAEGAGIYFLAYTVTRIASIISRVGLDQTLTRYTAAHASKDEWAQVAGAARKGLLICLSLALLATMTVLLLAPLLADLFSEPELTEPLRWMALSIVPWSLLVLFSQLLQGINRIGDSIFVQTIGIPLVNMPILLLLTASLSISGAAVSYTISTILILVLGYRLWHRFTPETREAVPEFDTRVLIESSIPLFWFDFTVLVIGMADTLFLGFFAESQDVGIYNTVKRVSTTASAVLTSINVVVAPQFAAMHARGELARMERLARNSVRMVILISVPVVFVYMVFPSLILSIFGEEFRDGSTALRVMTLGQFVNAVTGSVGVLLIMSGHEKVMRNIAIMTSILYISLLLVLTPLYGFVGAAWADALSSIIRNSIALIMVYRVLNIMTIPFPDKIIKRWFRTNLLP